MSFKEEYDICKVRKHQKSGMKVQEWDVCEFCQTLFKYVTELREKNVPE